MKIIDVKVEKQTIDDVIYLVCTVTPDSGEPPLVGHQPWINERGLWASKDDVRDPAEIAARLRSFADAIDRYMQEHKKAA